MESAPDIFVSVFVNMPLYYMCYYLSYEKRGLNFYINYLEMHFVVPKIIHSVGHLYLHFTSRCIPNLQTIAKSGFSRKKMKFNFQAILPFQIISIRKYNITLAFQFVFYPLTCTRSFLCVHKCDLSVFET